MEYLRLSTEDLSEQLRQLDVFSLDDVWFAIMETNGQMSVMKKSEKQPPDAMTLKLKVPDGELETVVVSDGIISESSLQRCDLSKDWLSEIFEKEKVKLEDIFIMTAKKSKQYKIIKKEK